MFTEDDVKELAGFISPDPILSVYLNTEPVRGNADIYKLRLRNMLKHIHLPHDVAEVERYLNTEYDWSGRGLIIFSCKPQNFFRTFTVEVPVPTFSHVGNRPSIKPMTSLLYNFGGYGVALVDKQGARLFSFHLGELREQEGMLGETVKRMKSGGGSSAGPGRRGGASGIDRLMTEQAERNMKEVASFATKFFEDNKVRRILIGGTEDNLAAFRSMLPKSWQSLIIGTFPMQMSATASEVLEKVMHVSEEAEKSNQLNIVENLITAAAKGGLATIGIKDTIKAANDHRVQTLILEEEFHQPGFLCNSCNGILSLDAQCEMCHGQAQPVEDVVDLLISEVLRTGGEVEVLKPNPPLNAAQHIGAILRF